MFDIDNFLGLTLAKNTQELTSKRKNIYMSFKNPGIYTMRILEPFSVQAVHYISKQSVSVHCLGNSCPICEKNRYSYNQYGNEAWKKPGYYSRQEKYVSNVLDRTPVVRCDACGEEIYLHLFSPDMKECPNPDCKAPITKKVVAGDKVKLVSLPKTVIEQIKLIASSVLDENGDIIPLTNWDINIISVKTGNKTNLSAAPAGNKSPIREISKDELFSHEKIAIRFSADELIQITEKDINYRDILASRKETEISGKTPVEVVEQGAEGEVNEAVNLIKELFGE